MATKQLSPEIEARIQQLWNRFPAEHAGRVLTLPVLHLAQKQFGFVDDEVMGAIAERLGVPVSHVLGVATFYTMINAQPVGRFHLQICTNIACMLEGGYEVLERCKRRLRVENRGTSADGNVTLTEVECLAACGFGPVAILDERGAPDIPLYFEKLDEQRIDRILDALERGRVPTELGV